MFNFTLKQGVITMSMINIKDLADFSDLFTVVDEPEFSKGKLLELQNKYGMCSDEFYDYYSQNIGIDKFLDESDLSDWLFNFEIFIKAGGDIWDLKKDIFLNGVEVNNYNPWILNCNLDRQAIKEEKHTCFSFIILLH